VSCGNSCDSCCGSGGHRLFGHIRGFFSRFHRNDCCDDCGSGCGTGCNGCGTGYNGGTYVAPRAGEPIQAPKEPAKAMPSAPAKTSQLSPAPRLEPAPAPRIGFGSNTSNPF
jgi:hypothetical protein